MPLLSFLISSLPFFYFPVFLTSAGLLPIFCLFLLSLCPSPLPVHPLTLIFSFSPLFSIFVLWVCLLHPLLPSYWQIHITDTNYIFIFESMKCLYVLPMLYTQISWVLGGIFLTSIITKISFILAFWGFSVSPVYSPPKKFKGFWVSHFHLNNKVIHCLSFNCLFILHFIFMINDDVNFHRRRLEVSIMLIFKFLNQLKLAKW